MTTRRLATLLAFVALGLSAVFLLPKSAAQPTGITLLLRDNIAGWTGRDSEFTQKERDVLGGGGTEFARKIYEHPQWRNFVIGALRYFRLGETRQRSSRPLRRYRYRDQQRSVGRLRF